MLDSDAIGRRGAAIADTGCTMATNVALATVATAHAIENLLVFVMVVVALRPASINPRSRIAWDE